MPSRVDTGHPRHWSLIHGLKIRLSGVPGVRGVWSQPAPTVDELTHPWARCRVRWQLPAFSLPSGVTDRPAPTWPLPGEAGVLSLSGPGGSCFLAPLQAQAWSRCPTVTVPWGAVPRCAFLHTPLWPRAASSPKQGMSSPSLGSSSQTPSERRCLQGLSLQSCEMGLHYSRLLYGSQRV